MGRVMAQNRQGDFTLSPFFGGQMSIFVGDVHLDGDYKWGLRAGYNFTPNWSAEFVYGANVTVHDPGDFRCTIHQYGGDVLYNFQPEKRFVPFIAAGFGLFDVDFENGYGGRTAGYFNSGAGVKYSLTRWAALRADLRHTILMDNGDNLFEATLALHFQFGRR
jgi:OOP family OmpA-OmpF porin